MSHPSHIGELASLGAAVCWTVTSMSFQAAGRRVGSIPVNIIRLVMALSVFCVWGWMTRGLPLPTDATDHAWFWLSVSGLVGFTLGDLFLFRAFVLIGARLSMLIMALVPLIAALTGWALLDETLSVLDWVGMAVTIFGVSVVVSEQPRRDTGQPSEGRSRLIGIALALAGAVGQATGLVLSKYGMGDYDPFAATHVRVIAGTLGFLVVVTAMGAWRRVGAAVVNRPAMARISLGAFFGPFLGVSLSLLALQHTQAGVAATIMSTVPVLIIPATVLVFRERASLRGVAGAIVAVAGVSLLFLQ